MIFSDANERVSVHIDYSPISGPILGIAQILQRFVKTRKGTPLCFTYFSQRQTKHVVIYFLPAKS